MARASIKLEGNTNIIMIIKFTCIIFTERSISFEMETYNVSEANGTLEVCIVSKDLSGIIEVIITPQSKDVASQAVGMDIALCDIIVLLYSRKLSREKRS